MPQKQHARQLAADRAGLDDNRVAAVSRSEVAQNPYRNQGRAQLQDEYLAALRGTSFADLRPLIAAGVGGAGLAVAPALARISVSTSGLYEPDSDGDAVAFIIAVRTDSPLTPEAADPLD